MWLGWGQRRALVLVVVYIFLDIVRMLTSRESSSKRLHRVILLSVTIAARIHTHLLIVLLQLPVTFFMSSVPSMYFLVIPLLALLSSASLPSICGPLATSQERSLPLSSHPWHAGLAGKATWLGQSLFLSNHESRFF